MCGCFISFLFHSTLAMEEIKGRSGHAVCWTRSATESWTESVYIDRGPDNRIIMPVLGAVSFIALNTRKNGSRCCFGVSGSTDHGKSHPNLGEAGDVTEIPAMHKEEDTESGEESPRNRLEYSEREYLMLSLRPVRKWET